MQIAHRQFHNRCMTRFQARDSRLARALGRARSRIDLSSSSLFFFFFLSFLFALINDKMRDSAVRNTRDRLANGIVERVTVSWMKIVARRDAPCASDRQIASFSGYNIEFNAILI